MRFLVLLAEPDHFAKWEAADDDLRRRVGGDFAAFSEAVRARGTIVAGEALDRPETARTVQPATGAETDAERQVTSGPYTETVEQVGGFYLVDLPDLDTAVEAAALLPREYAVEVRPTAEVTV